MEKITEQHEIDLDKKGQFRNIVFTWNNPWKFFEQDMTDEARQEWIDKFGEDSAGFQLAHNYLTKIYNEQTLPIQYMIYGEEYGENKTPHLQGYIEFSSRVSFTRIKAVLQPCYFARRIYSQAQNIDYCRKEQQYHTHGTPKIQGDRTDLRRISTLLVNSGSIKALLESEEITTAQELRVAERLVRYLDKPRDFKPTVRWYWGPSGSGKTRTAFELQPKSFFKTNGSCKWWPGYDSDENIIIDDLRPAAYDYVNLLGLLDRYPYQVEDKGTIREFRGRNIIITTPYDPKTTYHVECCQFDSKEDIQQLLRRIDEIREFKL